VFKNQARLRGIVSEVINKHDPEGLLGSGAPLDEYDPEIDDIVNCLAPGTSRDQAWILICNTLFWYFGDHRQPVLYWNKHREIADELVSRLPEVDQVESLATCDAQRGLGTH